MLRLFRFFIPFLTLKQKTEWNKKKKLTKMGRNFYFNRFQMGYKLVRESIDKYRGKGINRCENRQGKDVHNKNK